ncbi:MAG: hypothetical protein M3N39_02535, partial [Pseudomonadota bacterium]|nr:hypothetical protein [Pseudomonadota bacterium]
MGGPSPLETHAVTPEARCGTNEARISVPQPPLCGPVQLQHEGGPSRMTLHQMRSREFPILAGMALLGVVVGVIPMLFKHRFYLYDDMETQFVPMFYHIGRLLRAGEFPLITLNAWIGSNIAAEFQYAIFNPFSMLLYWILPSISDHAAGAAFLACSYYAVLAPGTWMLARSYGIAPRWAWLVVLVVAMNNFLSYWAASNWFPIFSSAAWLVWAWAFLRFANGSRLAWALAVVFSYLTITAGFPHAMMMLALVSLLVAIERGAEAHSIRPALGVLAIPFTAILLSAVALLAVTSAGEVAARNMAVVNTDFLTPNLRDVLQLSAPLHIGMMNIYGGFGRVFTPIFYVAWFVFPLFALVNWKRFDWRQPAIVSLLVLAGLIIWAMQGPTEFMIVRFFIRWLPYLHVAVLLLIFVAVTQAGFSFTRKRILVAVATLVVSTILSTQVTPQYALFHLAFGVASIIALGLFLALHRVRPVLPVLVLAGSATFLFLVTHAGIVNNYNFSNPNSLIEGVSGAEGMTAAAPRTNGFLIWNGALDPAAVGEFQAGLAFLETGRSYINGYTGVGHRPLMALLCSNWAGQTCPEARRRIAGLEPETGIPFVDLMRIDRLIVQKGPYRDRLPAEIADHWRLEFE